MGYSSHHSQWENPRKFLCLQENLKPSPLSYSFGRGLANNKEIKSFNEVIGRYLIIYHEVYECGYEKSL